MSWKLKCQNSVPDLSGAENYGIFKIYSICFICSFPICLTQLIFTGIYNILYNILYIVIKLVIRKLSVIKNLTLKSSSMFWSLTNRKIKIFGLTKMSGLFIKFKFWVHINFSYAKFHFWWRLYYIINDDNHSSRNKEGIFWIEVYF